MGLVRGKRATPAIEPTLFKLLASTMTIRSHNPRYNVSPGGTRPAVVSLAKVLFLAASQMSVAGAAPLTSWIKGIEDMPKSPEDPGLWLYLTAAFILVISGGAFAGLTIALMGQDGIYLQVIATSGEGKEQKHAQRVFKLLKRGKHWVLVTLLLANVIVNETLPIVLDRSLGGGWPAVLGSTALIVIFGEVIPQSICVRYGLQIGSVMSPFVLVLMYLLAPIAWPTAKLLDHLLGEHHGTVYKKSGLKTLVTLHKTLGSTPGDRLNQDEVTIISAVLDLKDKAVGDIMTPMGDVFTMSVDTVLDEETMDAILTAGYSRIPIYEPGNENNFIGMLLVKMLITYDPEDCKKVGEFALATLPETSPETSCLDIVNFFQEGKSHMVLVSEYPGEDHGAIGVVTLEDVIEELIGEEIIDESDVYIDVHKAIRRLAPAPTYRRAARGQVVADSDIPKLQSLQGSPVVGADENSKGSSSGRRQLSLDGKAPGQSPVTFGTSPKATFMIRRSSAAADGGSVTVRGNATDMREHLKHLGPSNLASRPKTTRYSTVKIKPGLVKDTKDHPTSVHEDLVVFEDDSEMYSAPYGGEGEGLLQSAGRPASDGVLALQQGYGSIDHGPTHRTSSPLWAHKLQQADINEPDKSQSTEGLPSKGSPPRRPELHESDSGGTISSLRSGLASPAPRKRGTARSGSITENIGVRKVVLQTTSSSDGDDALYSQHDEDGAKNTRETNVQLVEPQPAEEAASDGQAEVDDVKKKTKRRRKRKNHKDADGDGPSQDA
ncbi:hypothetical protein VC83_01556 [Pseudogymnoascus destructans]|uniref:CNNM transmembrane domain-containing protein n=2 Tax=Pseudogymnoascus destructans TaxID=655981 RepID=L8FYZ2_PSED2|nr:uncharacterized protein VC83_01556 [Pseudogymnoascus destructans]ELR05693.1 hypothetical protein GMDG_07536 [Pseudogymnoascus destructans 20631-21]OAF61745.1 hypothetical protein VC83_01556 [Pseudogymnoascus destructans]